MPQDRKSGTAWDCCLSDYAYTRELAPPGWAWEFLRRNEDYRRDARAYKAGHPSSIQHVSGADLFRLRRKFHAAETWGLVFFADPDKPANKVAAFWLPQLITRMVKCTVRAANDNDDEPLSLTHFWGRRAVLMTGNQEQVTFRHGAKNADLLVTHGSFLFRNCALTFSHEGLRSVSSHSDTMKTLVQMAQKNVPSLPVSAPSESKYRDYLIALDGRLAGRSYRDIAEVLYGKERVGDNWALDTQGLKSKTRRAVVCGLALMNGGYRDLL